MNEERTYVAIDLKSFYASVECVERKREPLTTNLVVADESRTEKTICLAVSPSLKSYGISGRARLFEVVQQVRQINTQRLAERKGTPFEGESDDNEKIKNDPSLKLEYIVAPPRMALYIQYSTRIYQIYLKHVAPEDIHVYSIDEVFIDATRYLKANRMNGRQFCKMLRPGSLPPAGWGQICTSPRSPWISWLSTLSRTEPGQESPNWMK